MEKRRSLREERDCFDISLDLDDKPKMGAKSGREERKERKRKVVEKLAVLPFLLKDYEVSEDMNILKQVRLSQPSYALELDQAAAALQVAFDSSIKFQIHNSLYR
jgi:hypothetical protein